MDGHIVRNNSFPEKFIRKIDVSLQKRGSKQIITIGHHDCGEDSIDKNAHLRDIKSTVERIERLKPECGVSGIWLNEDRK